MPLHHKALHHCLTAARNWEALLEYYFDLSRHSFTHVTHACVTSVLRNVSDIFFSLQAPQALRRKEKDEGKKSFLPVFSSSFLSQGNTKPLLKFSYDEHNLSSIQFFLFSVNLLICRPDVKQTIFPMCLWNMAARGIGSWGLLGFDGD